MFKDYIFDEFNLASYITKLKTSLWGGIFEISIFSNIYSFEITILKLVQTLNKNHMK